MITKSWAPNINETEFDSIRNIIDNIMTEKIITFIIELESPFILFPTKYRLNFLK